jgi:glycosyltransferase involved in cell wall biosynthesis
MSLQKKICYVLGIYPNLSETFIQREIDYFLSEGYDVFIYSLKSPNKDIADSCKVDSRVKIKYFRKNLFLSLFLNFKNLFRSPHGYIKSFFLVFRDLIYQTPYETFRLFTLFVASFELLNFINKNKIEFIHSHFANASLMCMFSKFLDKSFTYTSTVHASPDIYMRPLLLAEQFEGAKKVITISDYNYFILKRHLNINLSDKILVVKNGIEIANFKHIMRHNSKIKLLAVGNFRYFKGFDILIEAIELVKENNNNFELTIIGDGPQMNSIFKLIESKNLLAFVKLAGALRHENVMNYLKESDIFLHASVIDFGGRRDGFPTVILEAISHSVPVISTYVSAIPELIINNETGLLVPEGNPKELSKALLSLISDPGKREHLARKAHEKLAESYDIKETTHILEKVIVE